MTSFAKDKSKKDDTYCPIFTAIEFNAGAASWVDKSLSYFTFKGSSLSLNLEIMRAAKGDSKWVRQHQFRFLKNAGSMSISGKGGSDVQLGNYTFGIMKHKTICHNLRLYYGPEFGVMAGIISNAHGGNNPIAFKTDISAGFTGMAVYDFSCKGRRITTRYQMSLPVLSVFTQSEQGYFPALLDGWRAGSWGSRFNMRSKELIGSNGYPMTIIVDKTGVITMIEYGTSFIQRTKSKEEIRKLIE
jgi:hypothetical protein